MIGSFNIWALLAGLGIFLLSMIMIETALEQLAGRAFKKFLRRYTNHPLKAIWAGAIVTAILQSSSIVSLMVLALVGAGIIELRNAIGIILGSNLGTTLTGWIVAYFGFSFDIESFALPMIAFGGLSMVFFAKQEKLLELGRLLTGLGFLFLGLDYMKSGIAVFAESFDISPFADFSPYWLFLVGFILTAVIQSSSAVMVIALSALNAGMFPLASAAAMVIGSDLGTTTTVLIGGIKGSPAKKRVALSHFIYNLVVDLITLAMLFPLLRLLTEVLGFTNPLLTLAAFHSSFNLLGIFIFLPFLKIFARLLERRFVSKEQTIARFIRNVLIEVPELALEAMQKEISHLIDRVFLLQLTILDLDKEALYKTGLSKPDNETLVAEQYLAIKELEGEMVEFYIGIHQKQLERPEAIHLKQLILSIQQAMTSAKGMKDVNHNFRDFDRSVNDQLLALLDILKNNQQRLYRELYQIFQSPSSSTYFESLADLKKASKQNYNNWLDQAYRSIREYEFSDIEVSTLFNVNREIHHANKALIAAIKELLLKDVQSADFDALADTA